MCNSSKSSAAAPAVKERPILFDGPMVNAILDGRKTQTRRVLPLVETGAPSRGPIYVDYDVWTEQPAYITDGVVQIAKCPYGRLGDRLWVRETWGFVNPDGYANSPSCLSWRADGRQRILPVSEVTALPKSQLPHCGFSMDDRPRWRPSIFMPRWASRITLEITDIRVERLQAISDRDCLKEGIAEVEFRPDDGFPLCLGYMVGPNDGHSGLSVNPQTPFKDLWNSINAKAGNGWDANPWVWVIEFARAAVLEGVV